MVFVILSELSRVKPRIAIKSGFAHSGGLPVYDFEIITSGIVLAQEIICHC